MAYTVRTIEEVLHLMKDIQGDKPLSAFAEEIGVSKQYLSNVFNGRKSPSSRLLRQFGYSRVAAYVEIEDGRKRK